MAKTTTKKKVTKKKSTRRSAGAAANQPSAAQIKRRVRSFIAEQKKPLLAQLKALKKQRAQLDNNIAVIEKTLGELEGPSAKPTPKARAKSSGRRTRRPSDLVETVRAEIVKRAAKSPKSAGELLDGLDGAMTADLRALTAEGKIVASGRGRGATYTAK